MKNKPNDIPYLGCRVEKINSAMPKLNQENFRPLYQWIIDRYKVHLYKDVYKQSPPWTNNPIIREYRFTNVRREHDKETKWVIENICNSNMSYRNKFANIVLFRMINKSETCKHFMPIDFEKPINWQAILEYVNSIPSEITIYTNAFYTSGLKRTIRERLELTHRKDLKPVYLMIEYCRQLYLKNIISQPFGNAKEVFEIINGIPGIGSFLSFQILIDTTYITECPYSENEFVVAGIGARKGLDLIFENKDGMTYEECLFWLRDNWNSICYWMGLKWDPNALFCDLPEYDRYMNVMSLQNCCCEGSKYIRAVTGTGRPRNKYKYGG